MRLAAKVVTAAIAFLGLAFLCLWLSYRWTASTYSANIAVQHARFINKKSKFEALIPRWRVLHPTLDECGKPAPPPGLVRFAVIGLPSNTGVRIGGNQANGEDLDVTVSSVQEAAEILHAAQPDLNRLLQQMRDASVSSIYQHESELHFVQGDEPSAGVMFIPKACSGASNYKFWAMSNKNAPFAALERHSEEWYFYESKN